MVISSSERPFFDVVHDIVGNVADIARSEVRLAKTELREELAQCRDAAVGLALGALGAVFGVLFFLLAGLFALSLVVPAWAAALIIAVILSLICAIAFSAGVRRFKRLQLAPVTRASLKENVEWSKQQVR